MIQAARPQHRALAANRARRPLAPAEQPASTPHGLRSLPTAVYRRLAASPWLAVFLLCAFVIVLAYIDYAHGGLTLRYSDGRSKLNMARRMWVDMDPGFGQIGGIWLPLPTLLMALTAWWNPMYYSGLSGSIWSMLAFAGTGAFLFLIGQKMTGRWAGGMVAVIALLANPSALYLSTTPMAEPLLLCGISGCVYMLMRVEERPNDPGRLFQFAPFALGVTLIRYEGWFMLGVLTLFLMVIYLRSRQGWEQMQARVISFLVLAGQGIVLWLVWEAVIFKDPLFFSDSRYSAHAIDVVAFGINENVHNLARSVSTYWRAMDAVIPVPLLLLAAVGVALYAVRELRQWRTARIAPLSLLVIPAFFIMSLYSGQAAIDVAPAGSPHYNIRYGLIPLPLIAAFAGYAAVVLWPKRFTWFPVMAAAALAIAVIPAEVSANTQILNDRGAYPSADRDGEIGFLRRNYDGGRLLIEVFKNNDVTFGSRIAQQRFITEGNPALFKAALTDPVDFARWIYAGNIKGDQVADWMDGFRALDNYYDLAYADQYAQIYRLKPQYDTLQIPDSGLKTAAMRYAKDAGDERLFPLLHQALSLPAAEVQNSRSLLDDGGPIVNQSAFTPPPPLKQSGQARPR